MQTQYDERNSMKKYRITASSISYYTLEVEAESEDEAWRIGKDADGGDFSPDGDGDWDIVDVEEAK